MSANPAQVAPPSAATAPEKRMSVDDVRALLHTHIVKTARFIKFLDVLVLSITWVAGLFALWLTACLVDHWIVPLPVWARWAFWGLGIVGTSVLAVFYLLPLLLNRINPAYAARRIENLLPEFKNGLIAWLELDQLPDSGVPKGIMAALSFRAARFIGGQDPSATVDSSRLMKLLVLVLVLLASLIVYSMISPKSTFATGQRIVLPWRSIAPPTRVQIMSVKPGNTELTQGRPLEVDVEVRGLHSDETIRVRYSTIDRQLLDQRSDLATVTEGFHYAGSLRTEGAGVEHELDYWIEAGDAVSGPYRVTLSPLPAVSLQKIVLKFPAYTKLEEQTLIGGDIEAIEGTQAFLYSQANQAMSRGKLEVNPEIDATGDLVRADAVIDLRAEGRQLSGSLLLLLNNERENPTRLTYRIRGINQRGDSNRDPMLNRVQVNADVPPEITLVGPENRHVRVRPNSKVQLEVRALDPDFGLTRMDIEVRKDGLPVVQQRLFESEGVPGRKVKVLSLNLSELKVAVGDKLECRAVARDNRHDPNEQKPAPNIKESEPLTLEVVGADQEADPTPEAVPSDTEKQPEQTNPQNTSSSAQTSFSQGQPAPGESSAADTDSPSDPKANGKRNQNGSQQNANSTPDQKGNGFDERPQIPRDRDASGKQVESQKGGKKPPPGGASGGGSGQSDGQSSDQQSTGSSGGASSGSQNKTSSKKDGGQPSGTSGANESSQDQGNGSASTSTSQVRREPSNSGGAQSPPSSDAEAMQRIQEFMRQQPNNSDDANGSERQDSRPMDANANPNANSADSQSSDPRSSEQVKAPSDSQGEGDAKGTKGSSEQSNSPQGVKPQTGNQSKRQNDSDQTGKGKPKGSPSDDNKANGKESDNNKGTQGTKTGDGAGQSSQGKGPTSNKATDQSKSSNQSSGSQRPDGADRAGSDSEGSSQAGSRGNSKDGPNGKQGAQGENETNSGDSAKSQTSGDSKSNTNGQSGSDSQGSQPGKGSNSPDGKSNSGDQQGKNGSNNNSESGTSNNGNKKNGANSDSRAGNQNSSGNKNSNGNQNSSGNQSKTGNQNSTGSKGSDANKNGEGKNGEGSKSGQQGGGDKSSADAQSGPSGDSGKQSGAEGQGNSGKQGSSSDAQQQDASKSGPQNGSNSSDANQGKSDSSGAGENGGTQPDSKSQGSSGSPGESSSQGKGSQGGSSSSGESGKSGAGAGKSGDQKSSDGASGEKSSSPGSKSNGAQDSSGKSGSGKSGSEGQSGSQSGSQSGAGESGSQGASGQSPGQSEGSSNSSNSGPSGNSGTGMGNGMGQSSGQESPIDKESAERTTQMVLDYLTRQKDQPDPQLLKQLNWSEQDLRNFVDRWNKARNLAVSPNEADRLAWEEKLNSLGLSGRGPKPQTATSSDDAVSGIRDSGTRVRPPESLRKQYDAFRKALQR